VTASDHPGLAGIRIGSIVIHCHRFDSMVAFWRSALGYVPREHGTDDWVVMRDPTGRGPNLSFQARSAPRPARSWLHLDLYAADRDREVTRLTDLGACHYPWRYAPGADYVVLADPDGNLFCVVGRDGHHA
jgi:catechol 2,3-dioxygenase-like lactoylglutathione lyase family enzyme